MLNITNTAISDVTVDDGEVHELVATSSSRVQSKIALLFSMLRLYFNKRSTIYNDKRPLYFMHSILLVSVCKDPNSVYEETHKVYPVKHNWQNRIIEINDKISQKVVLHYKQPRFKLFQKFQKITVAWQKIEQDFD